VIIKNLALSNDETQRSSLESSLKPMTLYRPNYCSMRRFHTGVCSSRQINLWHFSYRSSDRLQRRNAKSTQSVRPQTFAASQQVSYPALLSCGFISSSFMSINFNQSIIYLRTQAASVLSCPVIWSVNFTSSIFSAPFIETFLLQDSMYRLATVRDRQSTVW